MLLKLRQYAFISGLLCLTASIALLVYSFVFYQVKSTSYLQQGRDAAPYVLWGMGTAVLALVMGCFVTTWNRGVALMASLLLSLIWSALAGALI